MIRRATWGLSAMGLVVLASTAAAQEVKIPPHAQFDFRQIVKDAKTKVFPAVVFIKTIREGHESGRPLEDLLVRFQGRDDHPIEWKDVHQADQRANCVSKALDGPVPPLATGAPTATSLRR